jgi:cytoskeletal protein CcmA (bactofilin family)
MADSSPEFATVIGADANFKGDLQFESAAKFLGRFEGSIASKGKVHIADGSQCKATIAAKEVAVEGHIEGNVEASDRIEVKPTGIVTGDIVAKRMTMAEGASINGYCRIGPNGQAKDGAKPAVVAETKPASKVEPAKAAPVKAATAKAK